MRKIRSAAAFAAAMSALLLSSCGQGTVKNIPVGTPDPTPSAAADAVTREELSGLAGSYDTYIRSFVAEVDGFMAGDFDTLLGQVKQSGSVQDAEEWKAKFLEYRDKTKHWYDEFKAAQMIVPEGRAESYNLIAQSVYALSRTFEVYGELPEQEAGFSDKREEFVQACESVKVLWEESTKEVK